MLQEHLLALLQALQLNLLLELLELLHVGVVFRCGSRCCCRRHFYRSWPCIVMRPLLLVASLSGDKIRLERLKMALKDLWCLY